MMAFLSVFVEVIHPGYFLFCFPKNDHEEGVKTVVLFLPSSPNIPDISTFCFFPLAKMNTLYILKVTL